MENLAYLYILAEEDEQRTQNRKAPSREKLFQRKKHPSAHRATLPYDAHAIDADKAVMDCDRAHQSYPTFYL
ncbi:MAG: hypothetical protein ACAF41_29725 [Leptolyngbya sp. BL-A-14]